MNYNSQAEVKGLSRYLVNAGLLDVDAAIDAEKQAKTEGIPLVSYVVQHGLASPRTIATLAHQEFGIPLFDLNAISKESLAINAVDSALSTKHNVLPLIKRGNRLFLAASDPTNQEAIKEIQFNTGLAIEIILVEEDKLAVALDEAS
ncbi:MAG TPA: type IV-A pilus assembly ATPase PilB, partial [Armatimonadetes bacterium]|nr:type IV-A pilus assembly ATPase PilB [Armatimonadota bacterium]